ncbi:alpha/beta fold hydrolase [Paenibacillus abyssi]|uniref:Alpha/beta hydrolase n=1 Tax=Paenibacillus abyssi TaxID=1340531 RepID=A0A917FSF0_9BACL|nr:alpha/beta hydrolase [Paenibacillus abyssi]GGG01475.1 alpha/beta hydrolase [Paenibacillus abyssi]
MSSINYQTYGTKDRETILFLHGGGLSGRMWEGVASHLSDYYCIVPDLPLHGRSRDTGPLTLAHCIEQIESLIKGNTHQGTAHIVGLSLGGAIALGLLRHKPGMVKSALLSGTSTRLNKLLAMINNLNAPLYNIMPAMTLAKLMAKGFQIPNQYITELPQEAQVMTASTIRAMTQMLTEIELPSENKTPLLALVGDKETRPAKSAGKQIIQQVPHSHGRLVPGVGHVWSYQEPKLFADVIDQWIQGRIHPALRPF